MKKYVLTLHALPRSLILFVYGLLLLAANVHAAPSVAFHYGATPPTAQLKLFEWAVVEPGHLPKPPQDTQTVWFAYLSLGEVTPDRPYAQHIPTAWKQGHNTAWGSMVIDQSAPGWPDFVVEQMVKPLWENGYRGFFLDTLDSWQIIAKDEQARQRQIDGLIRTIAAIKKKYPQARLIANRGFETLPQIHAWLDAVAFESYFQGWNPEQKRYQPVSEENRRWLDNQLRPIREQYHLPLIAIDYAPPKNKDLARTTARKLQAAGFIPWVTDAQLETMGIGQKEILPRTVAILYDGKSIPDPISDDMQYVATILNYLGYKHRIIDVSQTDPLSQISSDLSGIISMFDAGNLPTGVQSWLKKQIESGTPWVALGSFGFSLSPAWQKTLNLKANRKSLPTRRVTVLMQDPSLAYESALPPLERDFDDLVSIDGKTLLDLQDDQGVRYQPIAITAWGGYALAPYVLRTLPNNSNRWLINPYEFLSKSLRLAPVPVPDNTTENGQRILLAHIDGDGFVSEAEMPGYPPSGEVMLKEILQKYPTMPITVSIIEGEIGPEGLYPEKSPLHEKIARQIFALPNVEIANHSFSHPFKWKQATFSDNSSDYHLKIKGYDFDLIREIEKSTRYIDSRLAPAGKKTRVFLWTGDCDPSEEAIALTRKIGLVNMNAGDTVISKSVPTLTAIALIGMHKGNELQIFAPNQNENVYTNNWTGPFYGYQRVIETFQMTESPRRLKPIDIYYHMYSASKTASLNALKRVYDWTLAQPATPMFASEYIERAQGFFSMQLARGTDGKFQIRDAGALRTLRLPVSAGYPDLIRSRNVAGFLDSQGVRYIHLSAGEADLALADNKPTTPYLAYANAKLEKWSIQTEGLQFALQGWQPLRFALGQANGCRLTIGNQIISGRADGELTHFELKQNVASEIKLTCQH